MPKRKLLYPYAEELEQNRKESTSRPVINDQPDWLPCGKPNYEKFEKYGWDCEKILVWLNID